MTRIRYSWDIRLMEWAIKRAGLWERYRSALGFIGPPLRMPIRHQVFLGVPFRRRIQALWCVVSGCARPHGICPAHHELLSPIIINGLSADQLRAQLKRGPQFRGIPVLPAGCEVQIVHLYPCRVEPDIEDEP